MRLRLPTFAHVRSFGVLGAVALVLLGLHGLAASCAPAYGSLPNLALPTAGGNQLWADVGWDDGWRVQRNVWTGHARLLDAGDVRRAWGSESACLAALRARRERGDAAPAEGPVVVLLHGLWRTRDAMAPLAERLEAEGYTVVDLAYPSTRRGVHEHAAGIARVLNGLPGEGREISFVTHSLGALVTRALLGREGDPWRARHGLGRAVFIAAPHQGAHLARRAARIPGVLTLYGEPSAELARGAHRDLPVPRLPFLNVAAARGTEGGWNPWIPGDDDGVVGVTETHLAGEFGHGVVRGVHTLVMRDPEVLSMAAAFLRQR